jgi:hypothetical protein
MQSIMYNRDSMHVTPVVQPDTLGLHADRPLVVWLLTAIALLIRHVGVLDPLARVVLRY